MRYHVYVYVPGKEHLFTIVEADSMYGVKRQAQEFARTFPNWTSISIYEEPITQGHPGGVNWL